MFIQSDREKNSVLYLDLKDYYFPMIEDVFDSYGLPAELKYMAVIESALNPNAVSRNWEQQDYGSSCTAQAECTDLQSILLLMNAGILLKATHAAARYMKDLYSIYNDWILVIAAYNCGPGKCK